MNQYEVICKTEADKLQKDFQHLIYSYLKIENLSSDLDALDDDGLADWESFSARFSRVADFFLSKYLRALGWPFVNCAISPIMITRMKRWASFLSVYDKNITG